jgi:hypothetical protein
MSQVDVDFETLRAVADRRRRSGDLAGAISDYQTLLAEQLRILGPGHPDILVTREKLTNALCVSGDTQGALREYEALLGARLQVGVAPTNSTSPGGRYVICLFPFEVGPHRWVETPELFDTATGRALLALTDRFWHLDSSDWRSGSQVVIRLRHYPDGRVCDVAIDCQRQVASVDASRPDPLVQLADVLARIPRAVS